MGFYLIGPLVTLIPLGSISSWAFKPYCDDGFLGISPTDRATPFLLLPSDFYMVIRAI